MGDARPFPWRDVLLLPKLALQLSSVWEQSTSAKYWLCGLLRRNDWGVFLCLKCSSSKFSFNICSTVGAWWSAEMQGNIWQARRLGNPSERHVLFSEPPIFGTMLLRWKGELWAICDAVLVDETTLKPKWSKDPTKHCSTAWTTRWFLGMGSGWNCRSFTNLKKNSF